ncbi:hypothetical protein [Flavobacterium sp.]|uniref:hypothetical protein n=1 Tax=Flavobacterium sp. TaxID=239 RepID=UPI003528E0DE
MNPDLFKPVFLKLNRAQTQVNDIYSILRNSWDENKIKFSTNISEDKLGYEVYTNDFSYDNFLEDLGIKIGEVAHNLRSALDNLVFATARTICDPPLKPKKLYFPIFEDEKDFYVKTKDVFSQIPVSVKELIINVQPFTQKKNNPNFKNELYVLSILHWLNNTDKHQTPKVLIAILEEIDMEGNLEFDNANWEHFFNEKEDFCKFLPVLPNSKVFEFRTTEIVTKMNMHFKLKVEILLEVFEGRMKPDILQMMQREILHITIEYLKNLGINI